MKQRTLGSNSRVTVSAIGLGCMGMSDMYGHADEAEGMATLQTAVEAGITLLDTGDYYGMGHNELLIQRALVEVPRDRVIISVKFGAQRDPRGNWLGINCHPAAVKTSLAYTLRRLKTDYIDIYRPGRVDPAVPIEDTVGAIADLIKAGYVRHVGLSEAGVDTIRRANTVHPVTDLQIEYSLISRGIEKAILPVCRELGIGITAYGVLSRGLISGHWSKDKAVPRNDFRAHGPRFSKENIDHNLKLVEALQAVAKEKGATVAQLAIAWVLSRGENIVPLVGSRTPRQLEEALGALDLTPTPEDIAQIEATVPPDAVAGDRYPQPQMATLDSEKN
jgi:aryl-alcohol dehydrogenase-like predicted oxidoreductase